MKTENNKGAVKKEGWLIPAIYTLALLAAAIFLLIAGSVLTRLMRAPPPGTDSFFELRLLLSAVNIALIIYLIYTYVKDYFATKAGFTIGIIAFLFTFLLYALSSFPFMHVAFGYPARGMGGTGIFSFVPMLFTAIALVIFLKISES